jgi:hypothetical protein
LPDPGSTDVEVVLEQVDLVNRRDLDGAGAETEMGAVFEVQDGLVRRGRFFIDRSKALAAAGRS